MTWKQENVKTVQIIQLQLLGSYLNALVHRDYSIHTEGMPIQIIMFENRIEIRNLWNIWKNKNRPIGKVQPDTRNPIIALELEVLKITENRYSGIPTIRRAMREYNLLNQNSWTKGAAL